MVRGGRREDVMWSTGQRDQRRQSFQEGTTGTTKNVFYVSFEGRPPYPHSMLWTAFFLFCTHLETRGSARECDRNSRKAFVAQRRAVHVGET